jgi:heterodisulfide reductase subunit A
MIQCVGCRNEDRNYCSRLCCSQSVKNALKLKEKNPEMEISILFRDMRTYGFNEDYYREASKRTSSSSAMSPRTRLRWNPANQRAAGRF